MIHFYLVKCRFALLMQETYNPLCFPFKDGTAQRLDTIDIFHTSHFGFDSWTVSKQPCQDFAPFKQQVK